MVSFYWYWCGLPGYHTCIKYQLKVAIDTLLHGRIVNCYECFFMYGWIKWKAETFYIYNRFICIVEWYVSYYRNWSMMELLVAIEGENATNIEPVVKWNGYIIEL